MRAFLCDAPDPARVARLRAAETIGRPAATADFTRQIEEQTSRTLLPGKRGPRAHKPMTPDGELMMSHPRELHALSP